MNMSVFTGVNTDMLFEQIQAVGMNFTNFLNVGLNLSTTRSVSTVLKQDTHPEPAPSSHLSYLLIKSLWSSIPAGARALSAHVSG